MRLQSNDYARSMKRRKVIFLALLVLAAVVALAAGYLETRSQPQERGTDGEEIGILKSVVHQGVTYVEKPAMRTYLIMGVDVASQNRQAGARQGGQADFLMLVAVDPTYKTVYLLQLDRDTMAEVRVYGILGQPSATKVMQICLSHGYGTTAAENNQNVIDAVENLLPGLQIDYYLTFHLEAIGALNDALGGVTVTLKDDFTAYDPGMIQGTTIRLNALQAEYFTRYRMEVGDGTNESRMERQRAFLKAAADILRERMEAQPDFIGELFDNLGDGLTTDMTKSRMAADMKAVSRYEIQPVDVLPGEHQIGDSGYMEFYVQDDAIMEWILRAYYRTAGDTL